MFCATIVTGTVSVRVKPLPLTLTARLEVPPAIETTLEILAVTVDPGVKVVAAS